MTIALLVLLLGTPPRLHAERAPSPPTIDGRLDEPVWGTAPSSDAFTQRFPDERQPPTERTTVRVLYDDEAIYLGIACAHRATPILQRLTRRDRELDDADRVAVTISSRRDRASAFRFAVSAAGVLSDGLFYDDTSYDPSWDENWEAATAITAEGWSAEFRIPLRVLRFDAVPVQEWGFNVERSLAARQEADVWAYVPRTEAGYVSRLGVIDHLVDLPATRASVELRPFVVASVGRQDAAFGLPRAASSPASFARSWQRSDGSARALGGAVGLDGRWHITRDLTLDATFNPDFAQVEADDLILNLTSIETFYPEKRPFFLEGLDIFATPLAVLYTRRIGAAPASLTLPKGEAALQNPGPSAIVGALKLVGRVGRLSVGALSALTSTNRVRAVDGAGTEVWRLADPPTAFNVLRLRAPVPGGHLGLIASATNRVERASLYPRTPAGAAICPGATAERMGSRCFHDAYVGGVDGRWRSPGADYVLQAQTLGSFIAGGQPAHLRDGTTIGPGDAGAGTNVFAAKQGGRHWQWWWNGWHYSRALQLNDAGYLSRQNHIGSTLDVHYVTKEPMGPILDTDTRGGLRHWRSLDGRVLASYWVLDFGVRLRNQWRVWTLIQSRFSYFDDREIGDGTALERADLRGWEVGLDGDPRRRVAPHLTGRLWSLSNGWYGDLFGSFVLRAHAQLDLELVPSLSYTVGEPRFIEEQGNGHLLFGRLAATSVAGTVRATYTFTPRLMLQGYGQLFLARGHYTDFAAFDRSPGSRPVIHLRELAPTDTRPGGNPDFQRAAFNASLVLRWEFRLGSTLYVVYSRSQSPSVPLMPGEIPRLDLRDVGHGPAADVVLVKISFWWG